MVTNVSPVKPASSRRQGITIFLVLAITIVVIFGIGFAVRTMGWTSRVDVAAYPASASVELSDKGKKFIQSSYLSSKKSVSEEYYKVMSTTDSCEAVIKFYQTEASTKGYQFKDEGRILGTDTRSASFRRDRKDLVINCAPASENYLKDSTGNSIIILVGD